jgi:hypothetical protein
VMRRCIARHPPSYNSRRKRWRNDEFPIKFSGRKTLNEREEIPVERNPLNELRCRFRARFSATASSIIDPHWIISDEFAMNSHVCAVGETCTHDRRQSIKSVVQLIRYRYA